MNGLGKEIMLCKARLAEERAQREKKLSRADGCIAVLREILDPYDYDNITSWDTNKLRVINEDLCAAIEDIREHDKKIAALMKDIGCLYG
jgi:hypothetical protein